MRLKRLPSYRLAAFTLVEISIVLIILGLLIGGILAGQQLIRAAELRGVITEQQSWQTATDAFRLRYNGLPGDFADATRFWPEAAICPPPFGGAPLGNTTCNGNGDGSVGLTIPYYYESPLFWQHMRLSGLIGGNYTGVAGPDGPRHHIIEENAPRSRITGSGWSAIHFPDGGSANQYNAPYTNSFVVGNERSPYTTNGKLFTPEEAYGIDMKMDDGKPAQGNVIAHWIRDMCSSAISGISDENNLNARYRLEDNSVQCSLIFTGNLGF